MSFYDQILFCINSITETEQKKDTSKQQDITTQSNSGKVTTEENGSGQMSNEPRSGVINGNENTANNDVTPAEGKNGKEVGSQSGKDGVKTGNTGVIVAVIIIVLAVVGGVVGYLVYKKKGQEYDPVKMKIEPTKEELKDLEAGNENTPAQGTEKDPEFKKDEKDVA